MTQPLPSSVVAAPPAIPPIAPPLPPPPPVVPPPVVTHTAIALPTVDRTAKHTQTATGRRSHIREAVRMTVQSLRTLCVLPYQAWRAKRGRKAELAALVTLGERMHAIGIGDEALRKRLDQLDRQVRKSPPGMFVRQRLEGARSHCAIALANWQLARGTAPSGLEEPYRLASDAVMESGGLQERLAEARATVIPGSKRERGYIALGYLTLLCLVGIICWLPGRLMSRPEFEPIIARNRPAVDPLPVLPAPLQQASKPMPSDRPGVAAKSEPPRLAVVPNHAPVAAPTRAQRSQERANRLTDFESEMRGLGGGGSPPGRNAVDLQAEAESRAREASERALRNLRNQNAGTMGAMGIPPWAY